MVKKVKTVLGPDAIIAALGKGPATGTKVAELAAEFGLNKTEHNRLSKLLAKLVNEGTIERVSRGLYAMPAVPAAPAMPAMPAVAAAPAVPAAPAAPEPPVVSARATEPTGQIADEDLDLGTTGRISVHPAGYGFVELDDGSDDVFVPAKYRGSALDGDRVQLSMWTGYKGTEGKVVRIISRGRAKLTGTLQRAGRAMYLQPDDPRIATDYGYVHLVEGAVSGKVGQAAVVEISRYPSDAQPELYGRLVRILGEPDDPRTEIEKIITCADIPAEFPAEALAQAEHTLQELGPADFADRIDLRDRPFMTIDPEDARDFDDALCIESGPRGTTRVWVAVADVSHYVRTDDPLDREAAIRGVSVYLPDRVIPMLPFPLSAGICSLNPEVDRCAMVVRLDFSKRGRIVNTGFAAAVIRSHARLDYPGVAAALSGDFRGRRMIYRRWAPALEQLNALAGVLRERRLARGSLMLDIPEAKVILDDDDPRLVRDVVRAKGREDVKQAYQLVEEFMIAANEAVGAFFLDRELATVWRVHAPPEADRLEDLAQVLASYGIELDIERAATPEGMKEVLEALAERPEARSLSFLLLRSLKQALYDTQAIGHFGLASLNYLHFTSPIRRYPDLLVHRLLKVHLHREGQASGGAASMSACERERLDELAHAVSQHERRALEAEREAVSMYRAYLMRDQVGEEFAGKISAVTPFGAFVEVDEPFIEGLIKIDDLGVDIFDYEEMAMRLRGRRSGLTLSLGDSVLVQITNVSVQLRRVDLRLVNVAGKPAPIEVKTRGGRGSKRDNGGRGGGAGGGGGGGGKGRRKRRRGR
jgi:ribonuclease R